MRLNVGNPPLRAYGLSSLGHGLRRQGEWERATAVYTEAIALWHKLDGRAMKTELQAALAAVHYAAGQPEAAGPLLETAVAFLVDNPQTDCDALGQLYLDCVTLLQAKGENERAESLRQQAVATLRRQADGIADDAARAHFLEGMAAHRRLFIR